MPKTSNIVLELTARYDTPEVSKETLRRRSSSTCAGVPKPMVWIGMKRLRSSCGRPLTGRRPRKPLPVGAISGAVFCMPSVTTTTERSLFGSLFHCFIPSLMPPPIDVELPGASVLALLMTASQAAAPPRWRKKFAGGSAPGRVCATAVLSKKTTPRRSCDHSGPPPGGASSCSHCATKPCTADLRMSAFTGPEAAPGGRSAMLPDLSRTRTTSKVLRPLNVALSAGATPSSVGMTLAGVSPVCFETCEHSTIGEATM